MAKRVFFLFLLRAFFQLNGNALNANTRTAKKIYKMANELIGTENSPVSGKKVNVNQARAKRPAGISNVPTKTLISTIINKIRRLKKIANTLSSKPYMTNFLDLQSNKYPLQVNGIPGTL